MAFKKTTETNVTLHSFTKLNKKQVDTTQEHKTVTLSIPLVIQKEEKDKTIMYRGFVPGLIMQDVLDIDIDKCKEVLLARVKEKLKTKVQLSSSLPYFPTNEEIKQDFDNVCLIKRIKFSFKDYDAKL